MEQRKRAAIKVGWKWRHHFFFFFLGPSGPGKGHKCNVTFNSPDERPIDVACTFAVLGMRSRNINCLKEHKQEGLASWSTRHQCTPHLCLESHQFLPRVPLSLRTRSCRSFEGNNLVCGLQQAWERKRTVVQLRPRTLVKIISCSTFWRIINTDTEARYRFLRLVLVTFCARSVQALL